MKKLIILLLGVALFSCTKQTGYKIDVKLDGAEGDVILEQQDKGKLVGIDTATIENGVAVFEGEVEYPDAYFLSLKGQRAKLMFFIENGKITIEGKADSIFAATVTGSASNKEFKKLNDNIKPISEKYMALYKEARIAGSSGDTTKANGLMAQVEELYESTKVIQENFIKENPSSYVSPFLLSRIQYEKDASELDSMVSALDPKLQEVKSVVEIKERISKLTNVEVGHIAPDFTQNDQEGNPVKFSDIYSKNELTLIDFWASWCGPCRGENPNVVEVYNQYKDKGFDVLGVSLDKNKGAWVKAIEEDGLTWTQVSDLAYWQNEAAKLYVISSIPSNLLVDKNGKIIAKNKRDEELEKAVAEFLGE